MCESGNRSSVLEYVYGLSPCHGVFQENGQDYQISRDIVSTNEISQIFVCFIIIMNNIMSAIMEHVDTNGNT